MTARLTEPWGGTDDPEVSRTRTSTAKRKKKPTRCTTAKKRTKKRTSKARSSAARLELRHPEAELAASRKRRKKAPKKIRCAPRRRKKKKPAMPVVPAPQPPVQPPALPPGGDLPVAAGTLTRAGAARLLWRAGFGPRPGEVDAFTGIPVEQAVRRLTRPAGAPVLSGPEPVDGDGLPIAPVDSWGHDHVWWLDRMLRSDQALVERLTLIWHDWFATSDDGVGQRRLMLDQNELFRRHALGNFAQLAHDVTADPAMLVWLNGNQNSRWAVNENYARELMELFMLGAGRGYTETDVRQLAKALTGWDSDWSAELGHHNFRYDDTRHSHAQKTIFGRTGDWGWEDGVRLCLENPMHSSFFVAKLWSYFVPTPPDPATQAALQKVYLDSGHEIRPVVEAILTHPDLLGGERMVVPPIVHTAGLLRAIGRPIDTDAWAWLADGTGQTLFHPPNVSGWDDSTWLDTSSWRGRWWVVSYVVDGRNVDPWNGPSYPAAETPEQALDAALGFWGNPPLGAPTVAGLLEFSRTCLPASMASWQQSPYRAMRQNALRHLIATSPDLQTS